jgi:hypothetical protein
MDALCWYVRDWIITTFLNRNSYLLLVDATGEEPAIDDQCLAGDE